MTRRLLMALLLSCCGLTVQAQSVYDVNHDGKVDAADVTTVVNVIMGNADDVSAPAVESVEMETRGHNAVTVWKDGVPTIIYTPDRVVLWNDDGYNPEGIVLVDDVIAEPTIVEQAIMQLAIDEVAAPKVVYTEEEFAEYDAKAKDLIAMFAKSNSTARQASTRGAQEEELAESLVRKRDNGVNIFDGVKIEQLDWDSGQWGKTRYAGLEDDRNAAFKTFWGTFSKGDLKYLEVVFFHEGGFPSDQLAYLKLGQVNSGKIIGSVEIPAGHEYGFLTVCLDGYLPGLVNFFPLMIAKENGARYYLNPVCVKSHPIVPDNWADMNSGEFGKINGISVFCNTLLDDYGNVVKDPDTGEAYKNIHGPDHQCVDLCSRYVKYFFPNITRKSSFGNAWVWPENRIKDTNDPNTPDKYIVFPNDGKEKVREGDLIVYKWPYWDAKKGRYENTGHIGVVIKTTDKYISIAHQNGGHGSNARPIGSTLTVGTDGVIIDKMPGTDRSSIFGYSPKPVTYFIRAYHFTEEKDNSTSVALMTASTTRMDFGKMDVGESVSKSFSITNSGNSTLTISSMAPSTGDAFSVNQNSCTINQGETKTFTVTFTPNKADNITDKIVIRSNASDNPTWEIQLSGIGEGGEIIPEPVPTPVPVPVVDDRFLIHSHDVGGVTYSLYKKTDKVNSHPNADGWVFYESDLTLDITKNGWTDTYYVGGGVYLDAGANNGQTQCMAIDLKERMIYIFTNSKTSGRNYTMDGYAYVSSLDYINFQRETVFTNRNDGWFPFFVYTNDALVLRHFSYAGYYAKEAVRYSNGSWSNNTVSSIQPSNFETRWKANGTLLIIE